MDQYKIAEHIYVQGTLDEGGVRIDGGSVQSYIDSELHRLDTTRRCRFLSGSVCAVLGVLCFIGLNLCLKFIPETVNSTLRGIITVLLIALIGLFGTYAFAAFGDDIQNHKDYKILRQGSRYIITPIRRTRIIEGVTVGNFSA